MSIALRSAADALDELRPAPEHVPAQDEVKRTLTKLSDARVNENGSIDAKRSSSTPGFRRRRAFAAPLRPESRADLDSPHNPQAMTTRTRVSLPRRPSPGGPSLQRFALRHPAARASRSLQNQRSPFAVLMRVRS